MLGNLRDCSSDEGCAGEEGFELHFGCLGVVNGFGGYYDISMVEYVRNEWQTVYTMLQSKRVLMVKTKE